jgi:transposase-like protein
VHTFLRATDRHLHVEREPVDDTCPECGSGHVAEYPVFSEGGWWDVRKCQDCLHSLTREPGPRFGSYLPLGLAVTCSE